jgi:hypothetical protein
MCLKMIQFSVSIKIGVKDWGIFKILSIKLMNWQKLINFIPKVHPYLSYRQLLKIYHNPHLTSHPASTSKLRLTTTTNLCIHNIFISKQLLSFKRL